MHEGFVEQRPADAKPYCFVGFGDAATSRIRFRVYLDEYLGPGSPVRSTLRLVQDRSSRIF